MPTAIGYNPVPMGRPWEYPRWRRVLMQAVMWVILAGTVGLAQLVVVERRRAQIELEAPVRVGPIWVRTPVDWTPTPDSDPDKGILQLLDENNPMHVLAVVVQRASVDEAMGGVTNQPGAGTQPIRFKGLNRNGVLMAWHRKAHMPDGAWMQEEILLAFTQLPSGYFVAVQLTQQGARIGPADADVVKTVADAITWAGVPVPKRRLPPVSTDPGEVD